MYTTPKSKKLAENKFYLVCEKYENELKKSAALRFAHIEEKFYNLATNKSGSKIKNINNDLNNCNRRKKELLSFLMESIASSNGDEKNIEEEKHSSDYFSFNNSPPKTSLNMVCDKDYPDLITEEDLNEDEDIPVSEIDKWCDYANRNKSKLLKHRDSAIQYPVRTREHTREVPVKNIAQTKEYKSKKSNIKRKNFLRWKKNKKVTNKKVSRGNIKLTLKAVAYKRSRVKTNKAKKMMQSNKEISARKNEKRMDKFNNESEATNLCVKRKSRKRKHSLQSEAEDSTGTVQKRTKSVLSKNSSERKDSKRFMNASKILRSNSFPRISPKHPLLPLPELEYHSGKGKQGGTCMIKKLQQQHVGKREQLPVRELEPSELSSMLHQTGTKACTLRKTGNKRKRSTLRELEPSSALPTKAKFTIVEDKPTVTEHSIVGNTQFQTSNRKNQCQSMKWKATKNRNDLPKYSSPYIKDMTDMIDSSSKYLILKKDLSVVVSCAKRSTSEFLYSLPLKVRQEKNCSLSNDKEKDPSKIEVCSYLSSSLSQTAPELQNTEHIQVSSENASASGEQLLLLTPVSLIHEQDKHYNLRKEQELLSITTDDAVIKKATNSLLLIRTESAKCLNIHSENDIPLVLLPGSNLPLIDKEKLPDNMLDNTPFSVNNQDGSPQTQKLDIDYDAIIMPQKQKITVIKAKKPDSHYPENKNCHNKSINVGIAADNIFPQRKKQKTPLNKKEIEGHCTESSIFQSLSPDVETESDNIFLPKQRHSTSLNKTKHNMDCTQSINICESKSLDGMLHNSFRSVKKPDTPTQTQKFDIDNIIILPEQNKKITNLAKKLRVQHTENSRCQINLHVVNDDTLFSQRQKQTAVLSQANEDDDYYTETMICQSELHALDTNDDSIFLPKQNHSTTMIKSNERNTDYTQSNKFFQGKSINSLSGNKFLSVNKQDDSPQTQKSGIGYDNITRREQKQEMTMTKATELDCHYNYRNYCQSKLRDVVIDDDTIFLIKQKQAAVLTQTNTNTNEFDGHHADSKIYQSESEDDSIFLPKQRHSTTSYKTHKLKSELIQHNIICQSKSVDGKSLDILAGKFLAINNEDGSPQTQKLNIKHDNIVLPGQKQEITVTRANGHYSYYIESNNCQSNSIDVDNEDGNIFLHKQKQKTELNKKEAKGHYTKSSISQSLSHDVEIEDDNIFLPKQRHSISLNKTSKCNKVCARSTNICKSKSLDGLLENSVLSVKPYTTHRTQNLGFENDNIMLSEKNQSLVTAREFDVQDDGCQSSDVVFEDDALFQQRQKETAISPQTNEVDGYYTESKICQSESHHDADIEDESIFVPKRKHTTTVKKTNKSSYYTHCNNIRQGKAQIQNKGIFLQHKSLDNLSSYKKKYATGIYKSFQTSKDLNMPKLTILPLHKNKRTVIKSKLKYFQDEGLYSSMKDFTESSKADKRTEQKLNVRDETPRKVLKESNCNSKVTEYIKISNSSAAERPFDCRTTTIVTRRSGTTEVFHC